MSRSPEPLVSIIIPTKNSARTLERTLGSIQAQTYRNIEVVLVDNGSTDRTREIATRYPIVRVYQWGPERSAQLNFGGRVAQGRYFYRVDSDFILQSRVVEEAVRACEAGADAVLIHNTSDPRISFWANVRKLERDCYVDEEVHVATRFMKRNDFLAVGGFLEALVAAEDYDLHNRLKKRVRKIGRIQAKEIHIGEPIRLSEVVRKHFFYGTVLRGFIDANPRVSWRQLSPVRLAYLRHWRDFLSDPTLTAGFFVYQYVRYASAIMGFASVALGGSR